MPPRYGDHSIFQYGGRHQLGFLKFETVISRQHKRAELRRHAKSGRYRSKRFFQDDGRPPSWICYICVRAALEGHVVVFIAFRNLVGIDAVVLTICMFFSISRVWLENAYSRPKNRFFLEFIP